MGYRGCLLITLSWVCRTSTAPLPEYVGLSSSETSIVFQRFLSALAEIADVTDEGITDSLLYHFDQNLGSVVSSLKETLFSEKNLRSTSIGDTWDGVPNGVSLNDIVSFITGSIAPEIYEVLSDGLISSSIDDTVYLVDSNGSPVDISPADSNMKELEFARLCSETKSALSQTFAHATQINRIRDGIRTRYQAPQVEEFAIRAVFLLSIIEWPDISVSQGYAQGLTGDANAECELQTIGSTNLVRITAMNSFANILAEFMRMRHLLLVDFVVSIVPAFVWYSFLYDTSDAMIAWFDSYATGINPANYKIEDMQNQVNQVYDKYTSFMLLQSPTWNDLGTLGLVEADKGFELYWEPQSDRIDNIVKTAQVFVNTIKDIHGYDGSWARDVAPPGRRLTETISSAVCSVGETNAFVFSQGLKTLLKNCLTLGAQPDNDEDVIQCLSTAIPSRIGVTKMMSDCFDCMLEGVLAVNRVALDLVRDACITDPRSSACTVDFSTFTNCSGYNMTNPIVRPFCSVNENVEAIASSLYRRSVFTCVKRTDSNLDSCVGELAAGMSASCLGCWTDLVRKVGGLADAAPCIADPASDMCLSLLKADIVSFAVCSGGIDPIYLDLQRIRGDDATNSSQRLVFGWISILTLLAVLFN